MGQSWFYFSILLVITGGTIFAEVPNFFIIGAMKCGTTSLHKLFKDHPEFCGCDVKEKHFFDHALLDGVDQKQSALMEYEKQFECCDASGQNLIDATPSYIRDESTPRRLRDAYNPKEFKQKKFILVLREPVARHYSEYQFRLRNCMMMFDKDLMQREMKSNRRTVGDTSCKWAAKNFGSGMAFEDIQFYTFAEWIRSPHGRNELDRGYYFDQISNWLKYVERDQLFVINFSTLLAETPKVMSGLAAFLGLETGWPQNVTLPVPQEPKPPKSFGNVSLEMDCTSYDQLAFHYDNKNANLTKLINSRQAPGHGIMFLGSKFHREPEFPEFARERYRCAGSSSSFHGHFDEFGDYKSPLNSNMPWLWDEGTVDRRGLRGGVGGTPTKEEIHDSHDSILLRDFDDYEDSKMVEVLKSHLLRIQWGEWESGGV